MNRLGAVCAVRKGGEEFRWGRRWVSKVKGRMGVVLLLKDLITCRPVYCASLLFLTWTHLVGGLFFAQKQLARPEEALYDIYYIHI